MVAQQTAGSAPSASVPNAVVKEGAGNECSSDSNDDSSSSSSSSDDEEEDLSPFAKAKMRIQVLVN